MKFWIKTRHNPQLGTYYKACGQMTKKDAKANEKPLYGSNEMTAYNTEAEYLAKIEELKAAGERVS